ncbi:hypothetical protein GHL01_00445 [Sinorhizobium meliloti]|nr:hypothetical protein [Sinorhizobium meliloti]
MTKRRNRQADSAEERTTSEALARLFEAELPGLPDPSHVSRSAFVSGYRPAARLMVSEWADKNRVLAGVGAAEPGPWRTDRTPYLRELMDNLSAGSEVWKQSLIAGAQLGKTESGLNWIGYQIDNAPGPFMFVLPKADTAKKVSKQRIAPLLNSTASLRKKITDRNLLSLEYLGGMMFFASAQSASDLMSMPVKDLYLDEVDRMPVDVEGEGPPFNLAVARTRTFKSKRKIYFTSTPTHESTSVIWNEGWLKGDMRLYFMPCPLDGCGKLITYEFENLKWEWGRSKETVHYQCPECQGKIYEREKTGMLAKGRWIPTRKDIENVEPGVRSYRLPSLYSPIGWYSWDEMALKWEGVQGNPSRIAEFRNVDLALPSVEISERVDWDVVWTRGDVGAQPYYMLPEGASVPREVLFLTAGVDIGQDHIELGVWGWGRNRKRWLIDHIRIYGPTTSMYTREIWDLAATEIHRTYKNVDGVELGFRKVLVDTGYIPEVVKPWVRQQNQLIVMCCDGVDGADQTFNGVKVVNQGVPVHSASGKTTKVGSIPVVMVDVSLFKSELMGSLSIPRPEVSEEAPDGWVHMPLQGGSFTKEICKQLVSERKVIERDANGGITRIRWDRVEGRRAEVLDCHNYARGGAELLGLSRMTDVHFARFERELAEAAVSIKDAADADARGAPITTPPRTKVGVIPPKSTAPVIRVAGSHAPSQTESRVTITGSDTPRRIVPLPKMPTQAGDY